MAMAAAVGRIQLDPNFSPVCGGICAEIALLSIFLSLWDICCILRIYCTDFEATILAFFLLEVAEICTTFARSGKDWFGRCEN